MEYIKGKTPLFISLKKSVKENGILRSQTSVFYFSYKVSTVAECKATPTLLRENLHNTLVT